jgi:hypothetical protein
MAFNPALAALQAQIAAVESGKPKRDGKFPKKARRQLTPGPEIKFAKGGGSFIWKVANAKGTLVPESSLQLRGVILDYKFRFRDAGMNADGKFEQRCVSVSSENEYEPNPEDPNDFVKVNGRGWWSAPAYDHEDIFKASAPHGTQFDPGDIDPETGERVAPVDADGNPVPLTCKRCHELGYNRLHRGEPGHKDTNPVTCKDEGYIVSFTTQTVNPKTEDFIDLVATNEGFLSTIKMGRSSYDPYRKFMGMVATEYQTLVDGIVTEFSTVGPNTLGNYRLGLKVADVLEPDLLAMAKAAYAEAKAVSDDETKAYIEGKKAEREAAGGNGGSKPSAVTNIADRQKAKPVGAAAGAAKPKPAPVVVESEDEDDDGSIPF